MAAAPNRKQLRDTLQSANVSEPDETIDKWRAVRKDNVLAAARTISELGSIIRSTQAQQSTASASSSRATESISEIRNLLIDSESRMSTATGRLKLWTDEIRASVDQATKATEQLAGRLGEVEARIDRLTEEVSNRSKVPLYLLAVAIGIGVSAALVTGILVLTGFPKP